MGGDASSETIAVKIRNIDFWSNLFGQFPSLVFDKSTFSKWISGSGQRLTFVLVFSMNLLFLADEMKRYFPEVAGMAAE